MHCAENPCSFRHNPTYGARASGLFSISASRHVGLCMIHPYYPHKRARARTYREIGFTLHNPTSLHGGCISSEGFHGS